MRAMFTKLLSQLGLPSSVLTVGLEKGASQRYFRLNRPLHVIHISPIVGDSYALGSLRSRLSGYALTKGLCWLGLQTFKYVCF